MPDIYGGWPPRNFDDGQLHAYFMPSSVLGNAPYFSGFPILSIFDSDSCQYFPIEGTNSLALIGAVNCAGCVEQNPPDTGSSGQVVVSTLMLGSGLYHATGFLPGAQVGWIDSFLPVYGNVSGLGLDATCCGAAKRLGGHVESGVAIHCSDYTPGHLWFRPENVIRSGTNIIATGLGVCRAVLNPGVVAYLGALSSSVNITQVVTNISMETVTSTPILATYDLWAPASETCCPSFTIPGSRAFPLIGSIVSTKNVTRTGFSGLPVTNSLRLNFTTAVGYGGPLIYYGQQSGEYGYPILTDERVFQPGDFDLLFPGGYCEGMLPWLNSGLSRGIYESNGSWTGIRAGYVGRPRWKSC